MDEKKFDRTVHIVVALVLALLLIGLGSCTYYSIRISSEKQTVLNPYIGQNVAITSPSYEGVLEFEIQQANVPIGIQPDTYLTGILIIHLKEGELQNPTIPLQSTKASFFISTPSGGELYTLDISDLTIEDKQLAAIGEKEYFEIVGIRSVYDK